jgi:hypothetical protein
MERPLGDLPQMLFAFNNVDDVGDGINQFGKVVNSPRGIRFELDMVKSVYSRRRRIRRQRLWDQHGGSRSTQRQHLAAVWLIFDSLIDARRR